MEDIEPLRDFTAIDNETQGLLNPWKIEQATANVHKFPRLSVRGLTIRGSASSLLIENFPQRVPILRLVPLSLTYGSGVH